MERGAGRRAVAASAPGVLAAMLATAHGCATEAVDAVAVWLEADRADEYRIQVYDRGARWSFALHPTVAGTATDDLLIGVDGRGEGVTLAATVRGRTVYQSFSDRRRGSFGQVESSGRAYEQFFSYSRNDDALLREIENVPVLTLVLMALSGDRGMQSWTVHPTFEDAHRSRWAARTASAAPVVFWFERSDDPPRADGRVEAMAYPSIHGTTEDAGTIPAVAEPTVLGWGRITARAIDPDLYPGRLRTQWCSSGLCASPDGTSVTALADQPCVLRWWSWLDAGTPWSPVDAREVVLPECPAELDPHLVAQLADDVVVLDDELRLYLFDLSAGTMQTLPKHGFSPLPFFVDSGRALLLVSSQGHVARGDARGMRLVNAEQHRCTATSATVVSPQGHWVVQSCAAVDASLSTGQGLVLRISSLGLEQFIGIPMRAMAVDDGGNVLLYSYDATTAAAEPRGLFVLSGEGRLARVDELEPSPAFIRNRGFGPTWYSATAVESR